jgi:quinol monooxygenase YgiN
MYGLIGKLITTQGHRDELVAILKNSAADMPGCFSYVVANDASDDTTVWVTEVWDNKQSHDASLSLPKVRDAMVKARPIISGFQKIAETSPVWGAGLRAH